MVSVLALRIYRHHSAECKKKLKATFKAYVIGWLPKRSSVPWRRALLFQNVGELLARLHPHTFERPDRTVYPFPVALLRPDISIPMTRRFRI